MFVTPPRIARKKKKRISVMRNTYQERGTDVYAASAYTPHICGTSLYEVLNLNVFMAKQCIWFTA